MLRSVVPEGVALEHHAKHVCAFAVAYVDGVCIGVPTHKHAGPWGGNSWRCSGAHKRDHPGDADGDGGMCRAAGAGGLHRDIVSHPHGNQGIAFGFGGGGSNGGVGRDEKGVVVAALVASGGSA